MALPKLNFKTIPIYGSLSKKHQNTANLILGGLGAAGLVATASWLMGGDEPTKKYTPPPKSESIAKVNAPGSKVDPEQYWMATQGKRMDRIEELLTKMKPQAAEAPASASSAINSTATTQSAKTEISAPAPTGSNANQKQTGNQGTDSLPTPKRGGNGPVNPNAPGANLGLSSYPPGAPNQNGISQPPFDPSQLNVRPASTGVGMAAVSVGAETDKSVDAVKQESPTKLTKNVERNFMPIGFVRAELIGGLDAATGGQAQNDPQPVLFHLQDDAILPNGWRSKVRNCFVIGAGIGDLSSERAFIRLITLSCVLHNGQAIEAKVMGSAFGEDGKNGLRGRLITKQGTILANAAMASIASGIGKGFGNQGQTVAVSPLGTTTQQSKDADVVLRNSLAQGFGSAMDRLAQYWIERADKMFPVIEIDASRKVDLLFTKGVQVDALPGDPSDEQDDAPATSRHLNRTAAINKMMGPQ